MTTPPTPNTPKEEMSLEDLLKQYSIVRYDNPNGIYANSDADWNDALVQLTSLIEDEKRKAVEATANYILFSARQEAGSKASTFVENRLTAIVNEYLAALTQPKGKGE